MSIFDDIKQAYLDYIQNEWDKWLLRDWKNPKAYVMAWSVENFVKKHRISYDDFYELKRVPKNSFQQKCLVTRFVAGFLPSLSNLLWDEIGTEAQLLKFMKKLDTLKTSADSAKYQRERREQTRAAKEANAENKAHKLVRDQREYTAKSNWGHCK